MPDDDLSAHEPVEVPGEPADVAADPGPAGSVAEGAEPVPTDVDRPAEDDRVTDRVPDRAAAPAAAQAAAPGGKAGSTGNAKPRHVWWSRLGGRELLETFVLTGFALAQPLLSEVGKAPESLTYRRLNALSVTEYVLVVTFVPTLIVWAVERLVALVSRQAARWLHLAVVAVLAAIILIEIGKHQPVPHGYPLAVIALLLGIVVTWLVVRSETLRLYLRYASPAPLVFALLFVMTSPSGALVRQGFGGNPPVTLAKSTVPTAVDASGTAGSPSSAGKTAGGSATTAGFTAAPPGTVAIAHPNVVMMFFDEFPLRSLLRPDGTVNPALYPNFAWLSKNTDWFRNATGVSGFTPYAVPSMLRGVFPAKALPPVYSSYKDNILAELSGTYNVSAMETITALCPSTVCTQTAAPSQATGLAPTLADSGSALKKIVSPFKDKSDPTTEFADSGSAAAPVANAADAKAASCTTTDCLFSSLGADQPSRVKEFVNTLTPTPAKAKPTFRFLHVLLPHGPWHFDADGRPYPYPSVGPGHADNGGWLNQAWPVQVNLAREMMQLSYADKLLGDVLTKLRAEKILDKTLLVVTADHGEGFVPGDQARTMDAATAADLSWVPMFLKTPGETAGKLDERNWSHVDLTATISDALHVKFPQQLDGQSGLEAPRTTTDKPWFNTPGKKLLIPDPVGNYQKVIKGYGGVLGNATSSAAFYKLGPRPDLIGKKLSAMTVGANSPLTLALNGSVKSSAKAVTATSTVPTMVWGKLNGKASGQVVAIVVNGTIGAVVPTYADNGEPLAIEALVPPNLWHNGANDIEAYTLSGSGSTTQLHHAPST